MIENYSPGAFMMVDGISYHNDLKIIKGKVSADWWRREGHRLEASDIEDILLARPGILVVGTGYAGQMHITDSLRKSLKSKEIQLIAERTKKAVETFNRFEAEGKELAGAFHLTC
jgi:hypothetical protein